MQCAAYFLSDIELNTTRRILLFANCFVQEGTLAKRFQKKEID